MTDRWPYLNPDGKTYDGVKVMSDLSGLSQEEIAWTWKRCVQLMRVEGKSKTEALLILREEVKSKPWVSGGSA